MPSLEDVIENIIKKEDNGQLIKVGNQTIFSDDDFYLINASTNQDELKYLKSLKPDNLKDVFDNWNRISSNGYGLINQNSNTGDQTATRSAYSYNTNNKSIYMNMDSNCTSALISNNMYFKFWIHMRMYGLSSNDGANIFVLAYMVDKNNIFHDISAVRVGGINNRWGNKTFFLAYDFIAKGGLLELNNNGTSNGSTNPKSFRYLAYSTPPKRNWSDGFVEFYAEKNNGTITGKTNDKNISDFDSKYNISFTIPEEKPNDWSDEDWSNLKYMMKQPCSVGFGVQSQNSRFTIVDQQDIFKKEIIYDLENDYIHIFINNAWIKFTKASNILPNKIWIYNNKLKNLYWYDSPGKYIKIESNIVKNIKSATEGQMAKVMNDGIVKPHDNFIKLYAVDNNTDFLYQQSLLNNTGDTIYRLDIKKKYTYYRDRNSWVEKSIDTNDIPCRIFIYNKSLHRFFFYIEPGVYHRIVLQNFEVK